jgi:hypothetical protein
MGVRHAVLFRFVDGVTDEQVAALGEGLAGLPPRIAEIRDYSFGSDLGLASTTWDYAVVADFDSAEDYTTYRDHPDHRTIVTELVEPISVERVAVQFQT